MGIKQPFPYINVCNSFKAPLQVSEIVTNLLSGQKRHGLVKCTVFFLNIMCTENKREENNNRSLYCTSRTPELEMVIKENQEFKVIFNNIMNSKPCPTPIHTHTKTQKQKKSMSIVKTNTCSNS